MIQRVTDPTRKTFGKFLHEHGRLRSCNPWYVLPNHFLSLATVVADIAKSRAEIESARLLVLSAALQASWFLTHASRTPY
jgi:acyl-CoA dehydrogenase